MYVSTYVHIVLFTSVVQGEKKWVLANKCHHTVTPNKRPIVIKLPPISFYSRTKNNVYLNQPNQKEVIHMVGVLLLAHNLERNSGK